MECPACKGNIPEGGNYCPYCGKVVTGGRFSRWWIWAAAAGVLTGAGLVLAYQLLKEKRLWDDQQPQPSPGSSVDEELMAF